MSINQYIQYISTEKRFSPHTIKAYNKDLLLFSSYLLEEFELEHTEEANAEIIRSWMVSLMETGNLPISINRKVSSLRSYYKYLVSNNVIELNPLINIKAVKTPERIPKSLDKTKLNELIEIEILEDDFVAVRNNLVLDLLYSTGLRLSELISLKDDSVNEELKVVKILGKRNKERLVPLSNRLIDKVNKYKKIKFKVFSNPDSGLIITNKGKKAYPKFIYRIMDDTLINITKGKRNPHILRHSFATHMLNNGAELNTIKELLGHANLSATQIYTHNTIDQLKSIYSDAHPRAKLKKGGSYESRH